MPGALFLLPCLKTSPFCSRIEEHNLCVMDGVVRRSSRACVVFAEVAVTPASPSPPKRSNPTNVEIGVQPKVKTKSMKRCYKKVRRAVKITNMMVESRKQLFLAFTSLCRKVVGFYQMQSLSRCQMHAVNNSLGKNHLTFQYIEEIREKRLKALRSKRPGAKLPNLGVKEFVILCIYDYISLNITVLF